MGKLTFSGDKDFSNLIKRLQGVPDNVTNKILLEGAEIIKAQQLENGRRMDVYDRNNIAHTHVLKSFYITNPAHSKARPDSKYIYVVIKGERKRGKKKKKATRNAAIAFINNYGKKGQSPCPFITGKLSILSKRVGERANEIYENYIKEKNI
jgi:hypothetical protein